MHVNLDPLNDGYLRFARLVCVNTGDKMFPVQRIGSGVTVSYDGEFYLITARHVITNNTKNNNSVVVPQLSSGGSWWSTNAVIHLEASPLFEMDNAFGDLAVFSMLSGNENKILIDEYDYLSTLHCCDLSHSQPLFAHGYPDVGSSIDIDGRFIGSTLFSFEGLYDGDSSSMGVGVFKSEDLKDIDVNGMSGGPVTCLDYSRIGKHLLAGIIISGGVGSGVLHFIHASMLVRALEYAVPELRRLRVHGPFI
jgi:hypothetical protein